MAKPQGEKIIATNPDATRDYHLNEIVEAGLVLTGTEVKSLRSKGAVINDAYVDIRKRGASGLEAFLLHMQIAPYSHGNIYNHEPLRARKLLLHHHQIERLYGSVTRDGMTLVATRIYFKGGIAKIEIAVAKGKRKGDARQSERKAQDRKEMDQAKKHRR